MPVELEYLHRAYLRIRKRKGGNGFGVSPIEWPDIDAFSRLSKLSLTAWEVEVIEYLDDLFIASRTAAPSTQDNG